MKWCLEITDVPQNTDFPILGYQIMDNGVRRGPFYFRVEDLITALSSEPDFIGEAEEELDKHSTPTLPLGTIRYSANPLKTKHRVTMAIDKKMWEIRYEGDDEFYCIGFPRLIVQYLVEQSLGQYRVTEMRLFAVRDDNKPINDETQLYRFPFPNVNKESGIVCWGQNPRLEIKSLVELERAFYWFVSAPFNEDWGVRTTLGIPRFKTLIQRIKEQPFNDEWLIPANRNFADLF
ncbi:hypothetical protein [Caldibacillus debilis]|jgi:hypothetical protein|uniref:PRTRC system protein B n=1 Tax=Caldibacillus debilis TaxID=301148 RepID=A0A150M8N8_9BACI|nr:hypothetical protein [Caldibacillus debilis]KYD20582.1 hypothetical protein B4135_1814 [Caldibacillus debilis]